MWANSGERAKEVRRVARFFREENLVKTSSQVEHIADNLCTRAQIEELRKDFVDMTHIFKKEFAQGNKFRRKCIRQVEDIMVSAILRQKGKIKSKLMELFPLFQSIGESSENISVIASIFLRTPKLNSKERYYGACMLYLLYVEGIFDDSIRLLYVLKKAADGQDISLGDVWKKSLADLQKSFRRMGIGLLFDGWNRHLRNAIAHAHFRYSNKTGEMHFQDIDSKTGKITYDRNLNYKNFIECYSKIDDVCSLMDYFWMLTRIRDLIFAPDVEL